MPKLTLAQEYQNLLFSLMQKHVMNLEGPMLVNDEQLPVVHVSKDILVEKLLTVLNEFGESVANDKRFSHEAD